MLRSLSKDIYFSGRFAAKKKYVKTPDIRIGYGKMLKSAHCKIQRCLSIFVFFACGALTASISVGIVIPSTWFAYLYKQTVSITVVVLSTVIKTGTTAQIE